MAWFQTSATVCRFREGPRGTTGRLPRVRFYNASFLHRHGWRRATSADGPDQCRRASVHADGRLLIVSDARPNVVASETRRTHPWSTPICPRGGRGISTHVLRRTVGPGSGTAGAT